MAEVGDNEDTTKGPKRLCHNEPRTRKAFDMFLKSIGAEEDLWSRLKIAFWLFAIGWPET